VAVFTVHLANKRAQDGYTALILSAGKNHTICVRMLLDAGADMNAKNNVRRFGRLGQLWGACFGGCGDA
jgi:ankyrin repeat protein